MQIDSKWSHRVEGHIDSELNFSDPTRSKRRYSKFFASHKIFNSFLRQGFLTHNVIIESKMRSGRALRSDRFKQTIAHQVLITLNLLFLISVNAKHSVIFFYLSTVRKTLANSIFLLEWRHRFSDFRLAIKIQIFNSVVPFRFWSHFFAKSIGVNNRIRKKKRIFKLKFSLKTACYNFEKNKCKLICMTLKMKSWTLAG